jgi:AcrR family transcriptional regulator
MAPKHPFETRFEHDHELFAAALDEFSTHGYEQASINTILARAAMSKGQFYYHFGNKQALYLALIGAVIRRKQEYMAQHATPADLSGTLFDILLRQVRLGLAFGRSEPALSRFSDSVLRERTHPIYLAVLERYNFSDGSAFDALVDRAHAAGELRDDLPLPFIKGMIAFLFTHAAEAANLAEGSEHEERLAQLISFMRSGLARPT